MARGGKEKRLQKAIGALKDVTTVNLARTDGDYKQLGIAIMKATSQVERLANEKHIRAIFAAIPSTRPEFDVAKRIFALERRLKMTNSWVVALKTLIVIHRAFREVQQTFQHEFISYCGSSSIVLNMTRFKDDSSINARDYSAWIRSYALCLEERIHCYRLLGYDIVMETPMIEDLGSYELSLQLHDLQRLLFRVLGCLPQGAATHNLLIQPILSLVVSEGIKIYNALSAGIVRLINKSLWMSHRNAFKALNICRRAVHLADRFLELLEVCKSLDVGVLEGSIKMELSPATLKALEDHVTGADLPSRSTLDGSNSICALCPTCSNASASNWLLSSESDFEDYKIGGLDYIFYGICDDDNEDLNNINNLATSAEEEPGGQDIQQDTIAG